MAVKPKRKAAVKPAPRKRGKKTQYPEWLKPVAKDVRYRWAFTAWDRAAKLPGAWFDHDFAQAVVDRWPRFFRHTEGEWHGEPFILARWQEIIVRLLCGWKNEKGFRVFRRLIVWVGKKNGKSEFLSALGLLFWIFDGEKGGQGYCMASTEEQADIVFAKMKTMIGLSPQLAANVNVYSDSLWLARLLSRFKLLTGKAAGKHGISASVVVGDEMHEWQSGDLYTTLHQSTSARRQPIELLGSTAGYKGTGYGPQIWSLSENILAGNIDDPTTLVVIFAVPQDADWTDERQWHLANPNLGVSPKIEFLRAEAAAAKLNPRLENDFRRYYCNQWTENVVRWLPPEVWNANTLGADSWKRMDNRLRGRRCFGALDLSTSRDVTAWILLFPPIEDDPLWSVLCRFFVPEYALLERAKRGLVNFTDWVRDGAMLTTPGKTIHYPTVRSHILQDSSDYQIEIIGFDPWRAQQLAQELGEDGATTQELRQGIPTLGAPSMELERMLYDAEIDHGGHPVLAWMAGNCAIWIDRNGNFKPDKAKSSEKIDGMTALVMATALSMRSDGPSVYESRGIRAV